MAIMGSASAKDSFSTRFAAFGCVLRSAPSTIICNCKTVMLVSGSSVWLYFSRSINNCPATCDHQQRMPLPLVLECMGKGQSRMMLKLLLRMREVCKQHARQSRFDRMLSQHAFSLTASHKGCTEWLRCIDNSHRQKATMVLCCKRASSL